MIGLRKIDSGALAEQVRSMGRAKPLKEAAGKAAEAKKGARFGGRRLREGLKVISDFDSYSPWSGAEGTYSRIAEAGKLGELEDWLEEMYPEGISKTELNDLLWFDADTVLRAMGLSGDGDSAEDEEDEDTDDEVLSAMGESAAQGGKRILEYGQTASRRYSRFIKPYMTGDNDVELDYGEVLKKVCIDAMGRIDNGNASDAKGAVDDAVDDVVEPEDYWAILWHDSDYSNPDMDGAYDSFTSKADSIVSDYVESKGKGDGAEDEPDQKDYMKFIEPHISGGDRVVLRFDDAFEAVCKKAIGSIDDGARTKARNAVEDAVDSEIGDYDERNWAIIHHYFSDDFNAANTPNYDEALERFVRDVVKVVSDYIESEKQAPKEALKAKADEPVTAVAEGKASEGLADGKVFALSSNGFEPSAEDDDVGSFAGF